VVAPKGDVHDDVGSAYHFVYCIHFCIHFCIQYTTDRFDAYCPSLILIPPINRPGAVLSSLSLASEALRLWLARSVPRRFIQSNQRGEIGLLENL
jgi:hypothetical protein